MLVFTGVAGVTSIDAGITGVASVVIGGAGVAGVAGGTSARVTLCAEVLFLVVSVVVGVVSVLFSRLVRLLGCRSSFCSLVSCVA